MLHDENYKRLFASKLMVEHLLRACLPADLLAAADFSELGELSTEYVSDELLKRHGDTVWRLRLGEYWVYLLILLEFQSEDDPTPYQPAQSYFLLDVRRVAADDLPGRNLLRAVAGLEQSRSYVDLLRVWEALQVWLQDPRAAELQRAFVDWIRQMAERLAPAGAVVPPLRTWEDVRMTLVERVAEWPKQWLREGLEQGLEQQRALLCRMAAARFDDDTASRLADVLAPIADPERLAEIGDWLVRCHTAAEFLARLDPGSPSR